MIWIAVFLIGFAAVAFGVMWSVERDERKDAERETAEVREAHQQRQADYAAAVENNDYLQARVDSLTEQRDALQSKLDELHAHLDRNVQWREEQRKKVLALLDEVKL